MKGSFPSEGVIYVPSTSLRIHRGYYNVELCIVNSESSFNKLFCCPQARPLGGVDPVSVAFPSEVETVVLVDSLPLPERL